MKKKQEKPYKCMYCGRRFTRPTGHKCKGGFRKHHLKFEYLISEVLDDMSDIFSILLPMDETEEILIEDTPSQSKTETPLNTQVGGDHYKKYKIQPIEFAMANNLNACQTNILKYIMRYKDKNGVGDLNKAKHYIDLLIQLEYGTDRTC